MNFTLTQIKYALQIKRPNYGVVNANKTDYVCVHPTVKAKYVVYDGVYKIASFSNKQTLNLWVNNLLDEQVYLNIPTD